MLDFLRRISGISTPFGGFQWDNEPREREIIYEMLQALGNRRLIRVYHGGFEYVAVLRSCEMIREVITDALKKTRPKSGARIPLEEMRGAIHIFQTLVEERYPRERFTYDRDDREASPHEEVLTTLYALRDYFGERLSWLSTTYDIALPQNMSYQYNLAAGKVSGSDQIPVTEETAAPDASDDARQNSR
ncbi:MAG TPA: hypothetical protein VF584_00350 [Longimicrobium sp.]|jgi:hypothetical protein